VRAATYPCVAVARATQGGGAPLSFLARAETDRRTDESLEEFFLRSPMREPDEALTRLDRVRLQAATDFQAAALAVYEAICEFMQAESPGWTWGPDKVKARFGYTDAKPIASLFRGTAWTGAWLLWPLSAHVGLTLQPARLEALDLRGDVEETGASLRQALLRSRGVAQQLAAAVADVEQAAQALDDVAELREAAENLRRSAEQAQRAAQQRAALARQRRQ
jgi:hypothetical protein